MFKSFEYVSVLGLVYCFPLPVLLILVSVRFENLVIWLFGTEAMKLNLEEAMRRQRGNLPTPIECVVVLWVFGKELVIAM